MKTIRQILRPYLMPNEEYGGYDLGSYDAEKAMKEYGKQEYERGFEDGKQTKTE